MENKIEDMVFNNVCWVGLAIAAVVAQTIIRVILCWLKVREDERKSDGRIMVFCNRYSRYERFWIILTGVNREDPEPDFLYNFFIGLVELITFPIFIRGEYYSIIGAWLGYKVVGNIWSKDRRKYNGFLVANILLILTSAFFTHFFTW